MDNLNYGIVGNCKSGALVSQEGSIEWLCLPKFDSPSVFGKILDEKIGGSFEIIPATEYSVKQQYYKNTAILQTIFSCEDGDFEVLDFMPRYKIDNDKNIYCPSDFIRYFKVLDGKPTFRIKYDPKLEYAKPTTEHIVYDKYIKSKTSGGIYDSLYLYTSFDKNMILNNDVFTLTESNYCLLSYHQKLLKQNTSRVNLKFERTKVYWMNWIQRTVSFQEYREQIYRSAITLKLLCVEESGATLAALTTSLPETIGEVRNWDYRFCWIRDASMMVKVMEQLGHHEVAKRYLHFITGIVPDKEEQLQIMYGLDGEKELTEIELDHLAGYKGSAPVRVGNAAYKQKQNDIFGILLDVFYQHFDKHSTSLMISEELWTIVRNVVHVVARNWQLPDKGIWELRTEDRHFTFSKVLCWTAIDRAIKIAVILNQEEYVFTWSRIRDQIKEDIYENAWSEEKQAFTQAYYTEDLDSSVLLMENYGFIDGRDPKYMSTVKAIGEELQHKGLMFRYKNSDDFGTPNSSFTICTFWYIHALIKIGEKEEARRRFDELLTYSNHVGLFSEDLDFETKRLLGNIPQAYSHLALIETAVLLSDGKITSDEILLEAIH